MGRGKRRRLQGITDIPLNDVGRRQARDAVEVLLAYEWDVVVSSPLSRAAETADVIAAGLGLPVVRRVPELRERDFGPAEGMRSGSELEELRIPGGFRGTEAEGEAATRGLAALEVLAKDFAGARIVVITHGTLIRVSLSQALERKIETISNASLNVVHHSPGGWELKFLNGSLVEPAEPMPRP